MDKISLQDFLKNYPLYKAFKVVENYRSEDFLYNQPYAFNGETFMYHCENENSEKTFELELSESSRKWWESKSLHISDSLFNRESHLDFVEHYLACCKSCKTYNIQMTLHVWSNNKIPRSRHRFSSDPGSSFIDEFAGIEANIFVEKIGLYPEQGLNIDSDIKKHFDRETNNWYFKACKSIQQNYGIGAFAYFRRIIEKELITIVKEISELNDSDSRLKKLLEEYDTTNQIYSIYENIFEFLPKSLQSLGINPIKTLYNQTSEGLHSLGEKECLERANSIDLLLKFVIKKINEEQSEILKVREAVKNLK